MTTPASTPSSSRNNKDSANKDLESFFHKTVCLKDWWLVKAENGPEGKRLAVAGIASRGNQAVRVFSSAPILRRHGLFTLETVDETFIIIKGFLDKARTEANGFPSEVCDDFVYGFPPYWENYALNLFGEEPLTMGAAPNITDSGGLSAQASIAPEATEGEPSPRDCFVEKMKSFEMSENSPGDSVRQPLGPSGFKGDVVPLSEYSNVNDHQKDKYNGTKGKNNGGASEQSISKHTNFYGKKAPRIYETRFSWNKKDKSSIASPESLCLNRSRSGRLLLPTLEFWRNQRAIYDADGQVTGVKDLQVNEPSKGSKSEPQRKRRLVQ